MVSKIKSIVSRVLEPALSFTVEWKQWELCSTGLGVGVKRQWLPVSLLHEKQIHVFEGSQQLQELHSFVNKWKFMTKYVVLWP